MGLDEDSDEDFLGYVSLHSTTERALFANADVRRLCKLAGREEPAGLSEKGLTSIPQHVADPLVKEAMKRLRGDKRSPHALPEGDTFVVLSEGVVICDEEGDARSPTDQERLLFRLAQLTAEYGVAAVRSKLEYLDNLDISEGRANALGVPIWSSGRRLHP